MKVVKKIFKSVKEYINKYKNNPKQMWIDLIKIIKTNKYIIYMALPFILIDIFTRFLGNNINFYRIYRFVPNFFTILWIVLFLTIILCNKSKYGKIVYLFLIVLFCTLFLVQNVYYSVTSNFFSFVLLESASEGSPYFLDSLKNTNILVFILFIIIIIFSIIGYKKIPINKEFKKKKILIITIVFIILHALTPLLLGKANSTLVWSSWKNPRNIYNLYNDANKSMRVSGFYEYSFRNFYVTYLKFQKENEEDLKFLEEVYDQDSTQQLNDYTGIYNGKNLIFLQLEGVDNWLLTLNDTPTLYEMMNHSINFTNHYSFFNGGGSTFNSEFAVNTGFIVPFSYNKNAYTFNQNSFPYSMANLFKKEEYVINAFHMNRGEYYSRSINYKNWKYDNYYGLLDMYKYSNNEYKLDRELIENTEFSDLMFPEDKKFVDYIITYSSHMPFTNKSGVCKQLYDLDNNTDETSTSIEFVEMTEEECARRQVKETDHMVRLLLDKLIEKNLLDNTVIVVFTDHYLYTLEDKTLLDKYKDTSNNLINKTPFFIWDNAVHEKSVSKVTSQLNILPTVLNLYGINYNSNYYIGKDALDNLYSGLVFFGDYSWYDGANYASNDSEITPSAIPENIMYENNYLVDFLTKKNDLTLKYNYFKRMNEK